MNPATCNPPAPAGGGSSSLVRRFLAAGLIVVLMVVVACGRKTPPKIPDSPRPEAIANIKAITRDIAAFLSWPMPARNVEGRGILPADIQRFRIYRAEFGREAKKPRYKLYAEIDTMNPSPAEIRNNTVFWSDRNLKYGQVYGYRVHALSVRGGTSPPSVEVRVEPLVSLSIPGHLAAHSSDSAVQLSWDAVTTRTDGSRYDGFIGYNVYHGTEKGRYEDQPLNTEPIRNNSYKDTAVVNNITYYYIVRSVDSPEMPWKESLDSEEANATPRDMTSPARPTGLTVVPGVGRAFLTWNDNDARDLAGYYVYRSTRTGKNYERITNKALARTTFSDETAKPGATYYYMITAVDTSGNESAGSEEKQVSIEKPR